MDTSVSKKGGNIGGKRSKREHRTAIASATFLSITPSSPSDVAGDLHLQSSGEAVQQISVDQRRGRGVVLLQ